MCPETPEHGVTRVDGMRMIAQSAGRAQIEGRSTAMVLTLDGECAAAAAAALADSLRTCAPVARAAKPRRSRHNCDAAVGCRRPRPTQCLVRGRLRLRRAAPKGTPPSHHVSPPCCPSSRSAFRAAARHPLPGRGTQAKSVRTPSCLAPPRASNQCAAGIASPTLRVRVARRRLPRHTAGRTRRSASPSRSSTTCVTGPGRLFSAPLSG